MKYNYLFRQAPVWSLVLFFMAGIGVSSLQAQCGPGEAALNETYCYGNNDNTTFSYESADGSSPMTLTFSAGGIEGGFDEIIIYDGPDDSSPVLFSGDNGGDLSGVSVTSTGTELFMAVDSDGSVSCISSTSISPSWDWTVCNGSVASPPPPPAACDPGEAELNETYCYGNNDNTTFSYESADGSSPMTLTFSAGEIEDGFDEITIYDGPDDSSPVLFSGDNGGDLSGLSVTSTGTSLLMVVDSDGSVSCVSSGSISPPWDWTVCNGSVAPPPDAPANDLCADATPIECGETVTGSTTLATDNNPGFCGSGGDGSSGGVWYTITGTGGEITASACGSGFDTQLAIYEGGCGTLACVDGNDDFCGLQSEVSWNSTPGTEYAIYLDGFGSSDGGFTLSMSCAAVCDIALTGSSSTPETCPGDNDGTISVSASCTSCAGIEYSIGGAFQSSSTFSGLAAGNYTVTARDTGDPSCTATTTVTVGAGTGGDILPPWTPYDVGSSGALGNDFAQNPCDGSGIFTIDAGGNNAVASTTDAVGFVGQTLCGAGSITLKLESVSQYGYGGPMIRESAAAGAKQVSMFGNLTNIIRWENRTATNGPKTVQSHYRPFPIWLRLVRQGDWIFGYYSTTGTNFSYVHAAYVPMDNCVQIGMASFTYVPSEQGTTVFSNVTVTGGTSTLEAPENWATSSVTNVEKATLFPNPAQDLVTVDFGSGVEVETQLVLRNKLGQQVRQLFVEPGLYRQELNVNDLTSGMYLIELHREGQPVEVLRFIKQ